MKPTANTLAVLVGTILVAACTKKNEAAPTPTATASANATTAAKIFCGGVNDCASKSACKTAKHACAGKNSCKGQGIIELTEADCKAKGGTVEPNMM